jgi:hypothetical protein
VADHVRVSVWVKIGLSWFKSLTGAKEQLMPSVTILVYQTPTTLQILLLGLSWTKLEKLNYNLKYKMFLFRLHPTFPLLGCGKITLPVDILQLPRSIYHNLKNKIVSVSTTFHYSFIKIGTNNLTS